MAMTYRYKFLLVAFTACLVSFSVFAQGAFAVTADTTLEDIIAHYGEQNVTTSIGVAGQIVVTVTTVPGNEAIIYLSSTTQKAIATRFDDVYNIINTGQFEQDFPTAYGEAVALDSTSTSDRVIVTPIRLTATGAGSITGSSGNTGGGGSTEGPPIASPSEP